MTRTTRRTRLAAALVAVTLAWGAWGCSRSSGGGSASNGPPALHGSPCGELDCAQYASSREAFLDVLSAGGAPLVLAVGEAHAPLGAAVPSAAKRFTDEMLPALEGRASDLLLELMMPPSGCADAVAEARHAAAPITSKHAETAPNEYVAMGERARPLGIVPDMLRPTCADMEAIEHAGDELVDVSLTTIARLALAQGARLVERDAASDADRGKMVVLYGGSLHNDLAPRPSAAAWSYAPALDAKVEGRLVALDLVVPEFIGGGADAVSAILAHDPPGTARGGSEVERGGGRDRGHADGPGARTPDATWTSLPWWRAYDAARKRPAWRPDRATLFRTGRQSFVLIFAEGRD